MRVFSLFIIIGVVLLPLYTAISGNVISLTAEGDPATPLKWGQTPEQVRNAVMTDIHLRDTKWGRKGILDAEFLGQRVKASLSFSMDKANSVWRLSHISFLIARVANLDTSLTKRSFPMRFPRLCLDLSRYGYSYYDWESPNARLRRDATIMRVTNKKAGDSTRVILSYNCVYGNDWPPFEKPSSCLRIGMSYDEVKKKMQVGKESHVVREDPATEGECASITFDLAYQCSFPIQFDEVVCLFEPYKGEDRMKGILLTAEYSSKQEALDNYKQLEGYIPSKISVPYNGPSCSDCIASARWWCPSAPNTSIYLSYQDDKYVLTFLYVNYLSYGSPIQLAILP